jgi:hypothetical protein
VGMQAGGPIRASVAFCSPLDADIFAGGVLEEPLRMIWVREARQITQKFRTKILQLFLRS